MKSYSPVRSVAVFVAVTLLPLCAGCQPPLATQTPRPSSQPHQLDGRQLYEAATELNAIASAGGGIALARGVLIEDDADAFALFDPAAEPGRALRKDATGPTDTPYWQPISKTRWARKQLLIGPLSADSARLLLFAARVGEATGPLIAHVNGTAVRYDPPAEGSADPQWRQIQIAPALLRSGLNQVVLSSESEAANWAVLIAPRELAARTRGDEPAPGRSAASASSGRQWSDKLGRDGAAEGELAVRLWLGQHVLEGVWTGPVMDLAGRPGDEIATQIRFSGGQVRAELNQPAGCSIQWRIRNGSSPFVTRETWGRWRPIVLGADGQVRLDRLAEPYVQLQATLRTDDPAVSPSIRSLRVAGVQGVAQPMPPGRLEVIRFDNQSLCWPAIEFQYETLPQPSLRVLNNRFGWSSVVNKTRTPFEKAVRALGWASRPGLGIFVPSHSWFAGQILATQLDRRGEPLAHQLVLCQGLLHEGIIARVVAFAGPGRTRTAAEFWSVEYNKWVLLDAATGRYFIDAGDALPQSAMQLHNRLIARGVRWRQGDGESGPAADALGLRAVSSAGLLDPAAPVPSWLAGAMLMIPANDFVSRPQPGVVNIEAIPPGWSGLVGWAGTSAGPQPGPWIARQVDREQDFNWPLNRVEMHLQYGNSPGEIRVFAQTNCPSLDSFQVNVDQGGWKVVPDNFRWLLVPGENRLELRVKNKAGAVGPTSFVHVRYFPPGPTQP